MSVVFDTGIVYAYYDRSDRWHARARRLIEEERRGRILPAPAIAEIDHLLGQRLGPKSRLSLYEGIVDGSYLVSDLPREGYQAVADMNRRFADLDVGFVDAAFGAIAQALGVHRIATADRRHFEPLAAAFGLQLLP